MKITKREILRENLDNFYTKEACYNLYTEYFKNLIADGIIGENLNIFELSMIDENTDKDFFIDLMIEIFFSKEKFQKVYSTFDKDVQGLFNILIWEREYNIFSDENKEKFLLNNEESTNLDLSKKIQFFKLKSLNNGEYTIYLEYEIAKFLRNYVEKPVDYYLYDASSELEKSQKLYRDDNESEFINNLSLYLEFQKSGLIKISESGKVLKDTKREMLKHCNITEFYGDSKGLEYIKTEIICIFLSLLSDKSKEEKYLNSANIKNIISDFISTKNVSKELHYPYTSLFLNYLKGTRNIWENSENLKAVSESLISLLKEARENDILSVKNITKAFIYRDKDTELISLKDIKDYIYINEANYERTKILKYEDYEEFVIEPFVKSYLFLLGTLGIFQIFYTKPEKNSKLYLKNGYLSQYNGIKFIKLTDLGKYVLGFKETYEISTNYEKSEIFLDDKRLIVTILGESPTRRMFFEKVSKKIGNNIYKVTIDSFKKTVKSYGELIKRIEKFKKNVGNIELPLNWQEFFENLVRKFSSIEEVDEFIILKLKEDKELLQIIIKDTRFRELFLKAENYHLLVKKENIDELTKILKEYGYHFDKK